MNLSSITEELKVQNANLSGSAFDDVNLSNSVFSNTRLHEVRFEDADWTGTQLTNVNLSRVEIADCTLTGMKINGVLVEEMLAAWNARERQ